jgi:hypothetical protein
MKYVRCCVLLLLLNLVPAQLVLADGFGDRFRSWLLGPTAQTIELENSNPELDRIAQTCIECHNRAETSHFTVKHADTPLQFSNSGMQVNHPVGMNYEFYATKKAHKYIPRLSLDSNIILVDGKVTCVSCHQLKNVERVDSFVASRWDVGQSVPANSKNCNASQELTMGPRETDLCLACHNM